MTQPIKSPEARTESAKADSVKRVVSPRIRRLSVLAPALALAAIGGATDTTIFMPKWKAEPGDPIGRTSKDGEPFTDSRGRKYVRDEKGTIRRVG